jgi:hypothetical protein
MKRVGRAPLRHKVFLAAVLSVLVATVWPGYLPAARVEPHIFGLPFGLAWLVLCIAAVFLALLLTFRADMRTSGDRRKGGHDS